LFEITVGSDSVRVNYNDTTASYQIRPSAFKTVSLREAYLGPKQRFIPSFGPFPFVHRVEVVEMSYG
jgi:hypothetical protein